MDIALNSSSSVQSVDVLSPRERDQREAEHPLLKGADAKQKTGLPSKSPPISGRNENPQNPALPPNVGSFNEALRVKAFFSENSDKPKDSKRDSTQKSAQDSKETDSARAVEEEARRKAAVKEVFEKLALSNQGANPLEAKDHGDQHVFQGVDRARDNSEKALQEAGTVADRLNHRTPGSKKELKLGATHDASSEELRKREVTKVEKDQGKKEAAVKEAFEKEEARKKAFAELQQKLTEIFHRQEAAQFIGKHAKVHA